MLLKPKRGKSVSDTELKRFGFHLKMISYCLLKVYVFSASRYGKTSELTKTLKSMHTKIDDLRDRLDNEVGLFAETTDDRELNFMFYGMEDLPKLEEIDDWKNH